MDITLKPKKIAWTLSLTVVFLALANIGAQYTKFNYDRISTLRRMASFFDINIEFSLPTIYSWLALLLSTALVWIIAVSKRKNSDPYARHWSWLAVILLYLSVDEAVSLSEFLWHLGGLVAGTPGQMKLYGGLIPYGILVCVFFLAYLKFLAALPRHTRRLLIVAGVIFVAGTLGGAGGGVPLANVFVPPGTRSALEHAVLYSTDGFIQMAGVVVFIYALASYMASELREAIIGIESARKM